MQGSDIPEPGTGLPDDDSAAAAALDAPAAPPPPDAPSPAELPAPPPPVAPEPEVAAPPPPVRPPDDVPPLTALVRGLALLFVEGMSVGLGAWVLRVSARLPRYVTANDLGPRGRMFVLADMGGTGLFAVLAALVYVVVRRRRFAFAARRVYDVATRLGPLVLAGLVPLLLDWRLWQGRELVLLAMVTIFGLSLQALTRAALMAPPLGLGRGPLGRWTARPRAAVGRFLDRHPGLVARAPLVLVLLGATGYAILFGWATVINHMNLRTASLDLGLEDNLVWNALHWSRPFFKSSPLGGPTASHFGYHATLISYPLALLYAIAPRAETLLILQAAFIGGAAIPLFLYARRHVGGWIACVLAYAYLLYPPVHGANLYDFHYLPIGVFFLWMSLYALDARRIILAVVMVFFTLLVREDVAAGLAIIGGYLLLTGQRPVAGLVVGIIGAVYFGAMKLVIMPHVLKDSSFVWMFKDLMPAGDTTFGGVLKTAIANPPYTLNTLLERDKLVYLLHLFAPLAFLPLRRPIGLFCCILGFFFTLLSTGYAPLVQTSFQYTANWTTYIFMAMVGNLAWVGRPRTPDDPHGSARRRAWVVALAGAVMVCSYQFGAVFQRNTVRGGFGVYNFTTTDLDRRNRTAVRTLLKHVPPMAKIVAAENLVPQVSNRPDAYTLRVGVFDAEFLLFSLPSRGDENVHALPVLEGGAFGVVDVQEPYVLAKRGYKTDRNPPIVARMK